jgi:hypothetical protein
MRTILDPEIQFSVILPAGKCGIIRKSLPTNISSFPRKESGSPPLRGMAKHIGRKRKPKANEKAGDSFMTTAGY